MKLTEVSEDVPTVNLIAAGGGGGSSGYLDWDTFDWGGGGSYSDGDWGTTGAGWSADWLNPDVQQVIVSGTKMTLWEKMEYDIENAPNLIGGAIDSAISTFGERGYIGASAAYGLGVTVTIDMQNHDVFVGITSGAGISGSAGLVPEGMTADQYLTEWAMTASTPWGAGMTIVDGGHIDPIYSTGLGFGVSYSVNTTTVYNDTAAEAERLRYGALQVVNQAANYFNYVNGIPGGGGSVPSQTY